MMVTVLLAKYCVWIMSLVIGTCEAFLDKGLGLFEHFTSY